VSRFGVWIHPGEHLRLEAWGELCMSTVPDLQTSVLRVMDERPFEPLLLDLRRVWFCDLAGLRSLWSLVEHGATVGTEVEVRESASIARILQLVDSLRSARIA
jgi:anti-anti-sigma regulatory factor